MGDFLALRKIAYVSSGKDSEVCLLASEAERAKRGDGEGADFQRRQHSTCWNNLESTRTDRWTALMRCDQS